jgi:8-oxo-dGTP pyrophosphatase MutT (NUDIX family)
MSDDTMGPVSAAAPAATVLLLRDGAQGLEVLMVVRHHEIDFARGAAVFPGGKVSSADRDERWRTRCAGVAGVGDMQRELRVAAVRETFEECGLLLARRGGRPVDGDGRHAIRERWRARVAADPGAFVELAVEEDLELALDQLLPFAHWVTPAVSPKRFDTHFFIAAAPPGQVAVHDGSEAVDSFWTPPSEALRQCERRERVIIYPTLCNLALLARSASSNDALAAAGARKVQRLQPTLTRRPDGKNIPTLPEDSGYPALSPALMEIVAR